MLIFIFDFGPLLAGPDQKVGLLGEPFVPMAISKSCFQNFQGWITPAPLIIANQTSSHKNKPDII